MVDMEGQMPVPRADSDLTSCEPEMPDLTQPLPLGEFFDTMHQIERRIHEDIAKLRHELLSSTPDANHNGEAGLSSAGLFACANVAQPGAASCSIKAVRKSMRRTNNSTMHDASPTSLHTSEADGKSKEEDYMDRFDWTAMIRFRPTFGMADGEENMTTLREVARLIKEGVDVTDTIPDIRFSVRSTGNTPKFKCTSWTYDPQCSSRLCFDIVSLVVLMFELFYTPLSLTWSVKESRGRAIMIATTMFWLTDMVLSFFTAFSTAEGVLERSNCKVALHYLKTWFFIDLSCVAGDLVNLMLVLIIGNATNTAEFSNFLRVMKLARFLRVLGMVRVLRIMGQVHSFMEAHMSEAWRMMLKILQLTCVLVWIGHLVACCWYNIGRYAPEGGTGEQWIDTALGLEPVQVRDHEEVYQYAVAYHWGLAQITLGAHDVNPVNTWERMFTIVCNLFGLLFGGTLVSILSTTLIDLREMNADKTNATRILKDFLMQYDVPPGIRMRALQHFDERTTQRTKILIEKDVSALEMLSKGFLRELRYALYEKHITTHPLLRAWATLDDQTARDLCTHDQGLTLVLMLPHDELFTAGDVAKAAYYFLGGRVAYHFYAGANSPRSEDELQIPDPGAWISEAAWWCEWVHVGTLSSTDATPCKMLGISPENILQAMLNSGEYRPVAAFTRLYASAYHRCVAKATPDLLPTDLHVHYAGFADLVSSMPSEVHVLIGSAAVKTILPKYYAWSGVNSGLQLLEQEILNGRCIVVMDGQRSVKRYVRLLLLILKDASGNYLVEVADFKHDSHDEHHKGRWVASGRLPGGKQHVGTLPLDGILYVLQRRFSQIEHILSHLHPAVVEHTEEVEPSARFQVDTIYSKTMCEIPCNKQTLDMMDLFSMKVDRKSLKHANLGLCGHGDHGEHTVQCPDKVYVLSGSEHAGIYAWLSPEDFKVFRSNPRLQEKWTEVLKLQIPVPELVSCNGAPGQFGVQVKPLQTTIAL